MNILLKSVEVFHPESPFHRQKINIHLKEGKIAYVGKQVPDAEQVIAEAGLAVSSGWLDMYASVGDPGMEHKETLQSAAATAAKGGFTEIVCLPNLHPITQSKNAVSYIRERSTHLPVSLHPAAAVTLDTLGKDLTEMIDLNDAGAVVFTDGTQSIQNADVMVKALLYLQPIGGILLNRPESARLSEHGMIHEGLTSTQLGLKGIPRLAEEVMVSRDLQLLEYAGGRLHLSLLSTAGSVALVREAKRKGLQVTCDIASYQLAFLDENMPPFDTNYKVNPPFRAEKDRQGLLEGVKDGTIDVIVSAHTPQDAESKHLEFDLSEFGIINLETSFSVANTYFGQKVGLEKLIYCLTTAPRKIIGLQEPLIKEGALANLTFFHPTRKWVPAEADTLSRSRNSPFYGKELSGLVFATVHKGLFTRNTAFEPAPFNF
jgi:dihydroorotase